MMAGLPDTKVVPTPDELSAWERWNELTAQAQADGVYVTDRFARGDYPGTDTGWAYIVNRERRYRQLAKNAPAPEAARYDPPPDPASHIPKSLQQTTLSTLQPRTPQQTEALKIIRDWMVKYRSANPPLRGVMLTGGTGVGKTTLLAAAAQEPKGDTGYVLGPNAYVPMHLFAAQVRALDWHEMLRYLDRLAALPVLILDDVGSETTVDDKTTQRLQDVIYRRVEVADRYLLLATNLSFPELAGYLGQRIASRLGDACYPYEISGPDQRTV